MLRENVTNRINYKIAKFYCLSTNILKKYIHGDLGYPSSNSCHKKVWQFSLSQKALLERKYKRPFNDVCCVGMCGGKMIKVIRKCGILLFAE